MKVFRRFGQFRRYLETSRIRRFFLNAILRRKLTSDEENEQLHRWLSQVRDDDPCRLAMLELLSRHLLLNAATAGSLNFDDRLKLRGAERMEFARCFILEFEQERAEALERFKKLEERKK